MDIIWGYNGYNMDIIQGYNIYGYNMVIIWGYLQNILYNQG